MTGCMRTAHLLACAAVVCLFAFNAHGAGGTAWSKNEARTFLTREKALPAGGTLAATWLQATGMKKDFVQAMAIGASGDGPVTVRYVKDGRLLSEDEAVRLGLAGAEEASVAKQEAPMKPGKAGVSTEKRPVARLTREEMNRVPRIALAAPDMKRVAAEDAASEALEKPMRIGVFRDLPQPLEHVPGQKNALVSGTVWATSITSPGALGERIAFDEISLPPGAEVILYDAAHPEVAVGPLDVGGVREWPFWAPACSGETVMVECRFPVDVSAQPFSVRISKVAHIYRDPLKQAGEKAFAGPCNLDVSCRPEWADFALAVGGLGTIDNTGVLFCTCTLLADGNPCLSLPYVLTANHCVQGQTGTRGAESLEFYWRYQTATCNGTAPALLTVPRTVGGADYLAGSMGTGVTGGGNDFSFMRMRKDPPAELPRMGWSATKPPVGTPVVCIHHPWGDFKRISDGAIVDVSNPFPELYHQVVWSLGVTEPGSSGSPLAVSATGQIIGQLWGGGSSCSAPTDPDYYGRFDLTYSAIRALLEPPAAFMDPVNIDADEKAPSASVTISLSRPVDGATDLTITPVAVTAIPGLDYTDGPITVHFDTGQFTKTVSIPLLPNQLRSGDRTFTLNLSSPGGCVIPASGQFVTTVNLVDPKMSSLTIPWYRP